MKFGIVCSAEDPVVLESVKGIVGALQERGHKCELESGLPELLKKKSEGVPVGSMSSKLILAIGDDGAILRAFRELGSNSIPVLGISCGAMGFLAEIDVKNFGRALKRIERGGYSIEERSRLTVDINGKKLPFALNELAISATRGATIVRYELKVDGEVIFRDSADGIIVSTPTGSTGYALSAGGPVVSPASNIFVIIPICSINQNKPFVVNNTSEVVISEISSSSGCEAVIDGRYRVALSENTLRIRKAPANARFVRFEGGLHSRVFVKLKKKAETNDAIPKDAPPSAKFVYKLLQYEGALTQKEIISASMLPTRTVRSALNYLVKNGLVTRQISIRDTRQSLYFVNL